MKKRKRINTEKKESILPVFKFRLKMGTTIYQGTGATPLEALRALPKPEKIIHKGILTFTHGKLRKEMLFMPPKLKRIFYYNAQPILIKWIAMGLK